MSTVLVLEIKRAKNNKIFNFLKGRFSVTGGSKNMIFGAFSETVVRLVKSLISQFFSKYSKRYKINCQKLHKT